MPLSTYHPVFSFTKEVKVKVGQLRGEIIGIMGDVLVMVRILPDQSVVSRQLPGITSPFEDIRIRDTLHGVFPLGDRYLSTVGDVGPHHRLFSMFVSAQHRERIVMPGFQDSTQILIDFRACHWLVRFSYH